MAGQRYLTYAGQGIEVVGAEVQLKQIERSLE